MTRERLDLGRRGEDLAIKEIKRLGYREVLRNYRCPLGEVDVIARDGDSLVFIEVKTRKGKSIAHAKEAVDARKRHQLSKVALAYMKSTGCCDVKARFDVVAVSVDRGKAQVQVVKNAFELAY